MLRTTSNSPPARCSPARRGATVAVAATLLTLTSSCNSEQTGVADNGSTAPSPRATTKTGATPTTASTTIDGNTPFTTTTSSTSAPTHAPAFPSRHLLLSPDYLKDVPSDGRRWTVVTEGKQYRWTGCQQTSGPPAEVSTVLSVTSSQAGSGGALLTQVLEWSPTPWRCAGKGWSAPTGTQDVIIQRYNDPKGSPFAVYRIIAEHDGVWSTIRASFGETMKADDEAGDLGVASIRRLTGLPPTAQ
ncbi:hypothetical protein AB0H28_13240 [Micromonospora sp. NPDC050980]|uniref:hypothetical protein n=1 Tax=Micromonospora sp. NPDC050980 TaxID=3155161 RepID=UPI0033CE9CCD